MKPSGKENLPRIALDARSRQLASLAVVGTLTGLFLVLEAHGLGRHSFWSDEAFSVAFASMSWDQLVHVVTTSEGNMSLYFVALKIWSSVADGEAATRALSVAFALPAIPLVFLLGRRLFGTTEGMIAALLLSVNALIVSLAQEARGYSLGVTLSLASSYLFVRLIDRPTLRAATLYCVVSALSLYAHLFAALVIAVQAVTATYLVVRRKAPAWALGSVLAIALLGSPLALFPLIRGTGQIDWISEPRPKDVVIVMQSLAGGRGLLVAYFAVSLPCLLVLWENARARSRDSWRLWFVLGWLFGPILMAYVISAFSIPMFVDRYLVVCVPALVLTASVGLARIRVRTLLAVAVASLAVLSARQVYLLEISPAAEDWKGAAEHVLRNARPGDGIVFYVSPVRVPFGYYAGEIQSAMARQLATPLDPEALPQPDSAFDLACEVLCEPRGSWGSFDWTGSRRIWLVLSHNNNAKQNRPATTRTIQNELESRRDLQSRLMFGAIAVELYE